MIKGDFTRWLYRGQRPNWIAKAMNRMGAMVASVGVAPNYFVTLEVSGRKSGRIVSLPLVMVVVGGQRYLVSMLGDNVQWVQNVRAADGRAVLHCGGREQIQLEEVPTNQRAPILKAYLQRAPGARPHIPVDKGAALAEFEKIAAAYPVFRLASNAEIATHLRQALRHPAERGSHWRSALKKRISPDSRQAVVAINAIKSIHTLIFVGMGFCVMYILYSGLTGRVSRLTKVSFAVVIGEALIFFGNGRRCPLSDLAEDLGSTHGTVGDIFLPDWFARRIPQISSSLLAISLLGMLWHRLISARRSGRRAAVRVVDGCTAVAGRMWSLKAFHGMLSP